MSTYTVRATRDTEVGLWALEIGGDVGVTQSRTLGADAERMVRDYLRLDGYADWDTAEIVITPDLGDLGTRVRMVRDRHREIEQARNDAARAFRDVARELRTEGLSVTDMATVLGVSRGRVSQLVNH